MQLKIQRKENWTERKVKVKMKNFIQGGM